MSEDFPAMRCGAALPGSDLRCEGRADHGGPHGHGDTRWTDSEAAEAVEQLLQRAEAQQLDQPALLLDLIGKAIALSADGARVSGDLTGWSTVAGEPVLRIEGEHGTSLVPWHAVRLIWP